MNSSHSRVQIKVMFINAAQLQRYASVVRAVVRIGGRAAREKGMRHKMEEEVVKEGRRGEGRRVFVGWMTIKWLWRIGLVKVAWVGLL